MSSSGAPLVYMAIIVPLGFLLPHAPHYGGKAYVYVHLHHICIHIFLCRCWLKYDTHFIWALISPVILVIVVSWTSWYCNDGCTFTIMNTYSLKCRTFALYGLKWAYIIFIIYVLQAYQFLSCLCKILFTFWGSQACDVHCILSNMY